MAEPWRRRLRRGRAGVIAALLCCAVAIVLARSPAPLRQWQERAFDALILMAPLPAASRVQVVDIGASDDTGRPWDRAATARLAGILAEAGPAVIAWDVVFAGDCDAAGNAGLAAAFARAPTVLGLLLSATPTPPPAAPTLAVGEEALPRLWAAPGAEGPCPVFLGKTITLASVSLPADDTARVRMVPAAVAAGGIAVPALPVEALRRAGLIPMPVIAGAPLALRLEGATYPMDLGAALRFQPRDLAARLARTHPAEAVLTGHIAPESLRGAVILVGSSLPQRGGLRPTAADPLYPSVQIAADLAEGLLAHRLPWRPEGAALAEAAGLGLLGLALALVLMRLTPLPAIAVAVGLGGLWALSAAGLHLATGRLIDPVFPPLALIGAALAGLVLQAARSARAERALRARMGQLLPEAVVARLVDDPDLLRLKGERREVTALFTDLEGFSTIAAQLEPEALVACLDRYFAVVTAEVLRHGGMIDKIVGDAVHALFNAPLDQPGPVDAALRAARAITAATEALRAALPIGRTRIGIETGPAILGDVGTGARIDYTAHGPAVNLAARLQEMGKVLGPAVIIGPAAAAQATLPLRALGPVEIRSFGPTALFTLI